MIMRQDCKSVLLVAGLQHLRSAQKGFHRPSVPRRSRGHVLKILSAKPAEDPARAAKNLAS
jgi:hypothetical protein